MPNFDTGHLFLTILAPIKKGKTVDDQGVAVSYEQRLRMTLALLPTALQSPATESIGINSPFARNLRTHLCRFMVLNDVIYNGRTESDPVITAIGNTNPVTPLKVDQLNSAYLMFAADVDAVTQEGGALPATLTKPQQDEVRDDYARTLWDTMAPELREIFGNCEGFDGVQDAKGFADYLRRCQVETTMPFNDYWLNAPKLPTLPVVPLAALVLVPLAITLLALGGWLFHAQYVPVLHWFSNWTPGWTFVGGSIASALALWASYAYVMRQGEKPMPPGELADLPSVLKSLYLQQKFADLVVDLQGKGDDEIHRAFGEFVKAHEPRNKMAPTQAPGVVSSGSANAVAH